MTDKHEERARAWWNAESGWPDVPYPPASLAAEFCAVEREALERAMGACDSWPLSARNMDEAQKWARHGWQNAVAAACSLGCRSAIRALMPEEPK